MTSTIRGSDDFDTSSAGKNAAVGSVGSYAWLGKSATGTLVAGTTYAGSDLKYAGSLSTNAFNDNTAMHVGGATPSGTWRAMGTANIVTNRIAATLFLRIS